MLVNCYAVQDVHDDRLVTCKINKYVCMYVYYVSTSQMSRANAQYIISYRH